MDNNLNKTPMVSVIMPVYNGEKYLSEAIESVLNQTYKNFELIIVDDGSTDGSKKIINKFTSRDKRLKVFLNKKNKGISYTLNRAILNSKGKYIARLDCDDISLSKRLDEQVHVLEYDKDIAICGTFAQAIDENGKNMFEMHSPTGILLKYNFWKPSPFISSSVMVLRNVLIRYMFDESYKTSEDYDLWMKILKNYSGFNIPLTLVKYRIHDNGITKNEDSGIIQNAYRSFINNFDLKEIDRQNFLSLVCKEYKIGFVARMKMLNKIKAKIYYPVWFMFLDNMYYEFRKLLFKLDPKLNHYK